MDQPDLQMMAYAKVIKGDYAGKRGDISGPFKKKPLILMGWFKKPLYLNTETVDKYEIVSKTESGRYRYVKVYWKDGKKSLIECADAFIDGVVANCSNFEL